MSDKLKIQTASDIIRDGLGVELTGPNHEVLAEVFRNDTEHTLIVNTFENEIPLDALEMLKNLPGKGWNRSKTEHL